MANGSPVEATTRRPNFTKRLIGHRFEPLPVTPTRSNLSFSHLTIPTLLPEASIRPSEFGGSLMAASSSPLITEARFTQSPTHRMGEPSHPAGGITASDF